jgi:hypothetical protein
LEFRHARSRRYSRRCCRIADERGSPVSPFQRLTVRARHPPAFSQTGKALCEHMFSALPLRADGAQDSRHVRFVPILLKKSSLADQRNFSAPLARPARGLGLRLHHYQLPAGGGIYSRQIGCSTPTNTADGDRPRSGRPSRKPRRRAPMGRSGVLLTLGWLCRPYAPHCTSANPKAPDSGAPSPLSNLPHLTTA